MKRSICIAVAVAIASPALAAERLGRLFYTAEERAQLDQLPREKHETRDAKTEPPAQETAAPQVVTYHGIVKRSDGRSILWINERPLDEKDALPSVAVSGAVGPDGAVTIRVPRSSRTVRLKVGQSAEIDSGTVAEGVRRATPERDTANSAAKEAPKQKEDAAARSTEREATNASSTSASAAGSDGTRSTQ